MRLLVQVILVDVERLVMSNSANRKGLARRLECCVVIRVVERVSLAFFLEKLRLSTFTNRIKFMRLVSDCSLERLIRIAYDGVLAVSRSC